MLLSATKTYNLETGGVHAALAVSCTPRLKAGATMYCRLRRGQDPISSRHSFTVDTPTLQGLSQYDHTHSSRSQHSHRVEYKKHNKDHNCRSLSTCHIYGVWVLLYRLHRGSDSVITCHMYSNYVGSCHYYYVFGVLSFLVVSCFL